MSDTPFLICTYEQLALMGTAAGLGAHYQLGNNFNAAGKGNWTPIGESLASAFTGSLDGDGYLISHLTVNISRTSTIAYVGLFGYINGAVISNIALRDVSINVSRGGIDVGGLVGRSHGTIRNSYATGAVTVSSVAGTPGRGDSNVGGLVGWSAHSAGNNGTISNSYARVGIMVRNQR